MFRRHGLWVRWLAVAAALAVGWSLGVAAPAGGASAASGLAERITALRQQKVDWRAELGSSLAQLRGVRGVMTPVGGTVLADTVTVPGAIELTGDTTIIAREVVLATGSVRVHGKGHTLRIYPVASLRSGAGFGVRETITIDYTGTGGLTGANGPKGGDGQAGSRGDPGQPAPGPINCHGGDGQAGGSGGSGGPASDGGPALEGSDGGGISLEIPDGSTDTYVLITRGGAGGSGGAGGPGGSGGAGGNGGDGYPFCWFTPPDFGRGGNGGDGGFGGAGGPGGWGGSGGPGGRGGDVWVTYPNGFDLGQLFVDNSGGSGGNPGPAGPGGNGGFGGMGGQAGQSLEGFAWPGQNGWNGFDGPSGQQGWAGAAGNPGITRVDPR